MVIQPGGTSVGGSTPASSVSSAEIAIPPLSNGANPKWILVVCIEPFKGMVISFGQTGMGVATVTNGIGIDYGSGGQVINVAGNSHYRIISEDAAANAYTITPLSGINPGG